MTPLRTTILLGTVALLVPAFAHAVTFEGLVNDVVVPFVDGYVIPLLYALAFLFFLIGMVRFFFSQSDEGRESGRTFALWGVVGIIVLFTVWGIVRLLLEVLGV